MTEPSISACCRMKASKEHHARLQMFRQAYNLRRLPGEPPEAVTERFHAAQAELKANGWEVKRTIPEADPADGIPSVCSCEGVER